MGGVNDSLIVYFGRSTTYNVAFLTALEKAGYKSGGRIQLDDKGFGTTLHPDAVIIDSSLGTDDEVEAFVKKLRGGAIPSLVIMVIVGGQSDGAGCSDFCVKLLSAGASDVIGTDMDVDVFAARVAVAMKLADKTLPVPAVRPAGQAIRSMELGEVLGSRYELEAVLGIGGMGIVYRARDITLDRYVALKILPDDQNLRKHHIERFLREGEIMARLDIPEAVHIFDMGTEPVNYIVMELIQGEDLEQILETRLMSPGEMVECAIVVAKALDKIHKADIVHRDLKPSNIFKDSSGRIRILDFGISKLFNASVSLTRPGVTLGTPIYMAPEQLDSNMGPVSGRTDIYALGLIMYEMITGKVPFREDGMLNVIKEIVMGSPMSLRKVRPDIDPALDKIVMKATAKKPEARFASAGEMAKALEELDLSLPGYDKAAEGHE